MEVLEISLDRVVCGVLDCSGELELDMFSVCTRRSRSSEQEWCTLCKKQDVHE